jgi:hypothetical protein
MRSRHLSKNRPRAAVGDAPIAAAQLRGNGRSGTARHDWRVAGRRAEMLLRISSGSALRWFGDGSLKSFGPVLEGR